MSLFGREAAGRRHIDGLDVLRTLAIVGVTLFHIFPERLPGGYLGVSLFFVLTGFLLAYTSKRSWLEHRFRVKTYYMKRIKRIYPSLFIVLLTTIGVCSFVLPKAVTAIRPEFLSIVLGYNNWWQIAQNADYFTRLTNASPFTHLWFMGIEMQYYLVWPLLFALYAFLDILAGRRAALAVLALLALGSAAVMPMMYEPDMDVTRLYYGTDTRAYALLFGAVLGLWWVDHPRARLGKYRMLLGYLAWPVLVGASIAAYFLFDGQSAYVYEWGMLAMTVLFCVLLLLTADDRFFVGAALESPGLRWLGWLGKRSFGIYLWQYPVIYLFAKLGWTQLPYYAALEIAAILVLTIWSDALAHVITSRRLPAIRGRHIVTACIFLTAFTLPGLALMGFGGHAIAVSADQKVSDTGELQERLAANAAEQQAANDQAAAEAAEQKAAKDEAAVDLSGVACIGDSVMLGSSQGAAGLHHRCGSLALRRRRPRRGERDGGAGTPRQEHRHRARHERPDCRLREVRGPDARAPRVSRSRPPHLLGQCLLPGALVAADEQRLPRKYGQRPSERDDRRLVRPRLQASGMARR